MTSPVLSSCLSYGTQGRPVKSISKRGWGRTWACVGCGGRAGSFPDGLWGHPLRAHFSGGFSGCHLREIDVLRKVNSKWADNHVE